MFAVIRSGGKQYRIQEGDILEVEKLDIEGGQKVVFKEVLLIQDGEKTLIGTPLVEKAQVIAEVIENFKDKKIIVFKKKRRKQYKVKRGHRQELTRVKIKEIISELKVSAEKPAVVSKKEEEKKASVKPRVKKAQAATREIKRERAEKESKPKEKIKVSQKKRKQDKTAAERKLGEKTASKSNPPSRKLRTTKEKENGS